MGIWDNRACYHPKEKRMFCDEQCAPSIFRECQQMIAAEALLDEEVAAKEPAVTKKKKTS